MRETTNRQQNQHLASMLPIYNLGARVIYDNVHDLYDQGTDEIEAMRILTVILEKVFEGNVEKLALALGCSTEEIAEWLSGAKMMDADVLMKAKMLSIERGLDVEIT